MEISSLESPLLSSIWTIYITIVRNLHFLFYFENLGFHGQFDVW
jgi:hypothetical protein